MWLSLRSCDWSGYWQISRSSRRRCRVSGKLLRTPRVSTAHLRVLGHGHPPGHGRRRPGLNRRRTLLDPVRAVHHHPLIIR